MAMVAVFKNNGNTVTGEAAKVFVKIGIAREIGENDQIKIEDTKEHQGLKTPDVHKAKPPVNVKQKRGRKPFKK